MKENKQIVALCKNFYKITSFEPLEGDYITGKLIRIYGEYIFNIDMMNKEDLKSVVELDRVLGNYLNDYGFRKELQRKIVKIKLKRDVKNPLKEFVSHILKIFYDYEEYTTRVIYISRWI